jgi:putative ABC transport system permease protein
MELAPSRLAPRDVLRVGTVGLGVRRLRASLSAVGIAIGIAAMVAVLAISESSKADLLSALDRLGTNLLTISPGQSIFGEDAALPDQAQQMVDRIRPVEGTSATGTVDESVYRSEMIPGEETNGISVLASDAMLPATLGATLADGVFLDDATAKYPAVVLGAAAARRLGIDRAGGGVQVVIGWLRFTVVGILDPVTLAPELDSAALIGFGAAARYLDDDGATSTLYVRSNPDYVTDVRDVLGRTANPEHPDEVDVSRPSDAIEARAAAKNAFTSLFLGLGAVALLVGGVGVANVMVISVLERRSEIGLRRALGATRRHVGLQFLTESLLLSLAGGIAGVALGALIAGIYAKSRGWPVVVPPEVAVGGVVAALAVGAVAGLYPALRAARLAPTDALRTV